MDIRGQLNKIRRAEDCSSIEDCEIAIEEVRNLYHETIDIRRQLALVELRFRSLDDRKKEIENQLGE